LLLTPDGHGGATDQVPYQTEFVYIKETPFRRHGKWPNFSSVHLSFTNQIDNTTLNDEINTNLEHYWEV